MTAMFNDKSEIVQWYFDVAKEVAVTEEGIPYFDDLFLDVVVLPNKEYFLLDEDELQEALNHDFIDVNDYNLAKQEAEKLMKTIRYNNNELINRSREDLRTIMEL